jgi:NAD(P)-dependent dehydrogenase (short-subunit alcohol dehydrogenase family)
VSSVSAERGGGLFRAVAYSAAKAAELGRARALARELGPNGVTVNSVAHGFIETDISGGVLTGERKEQLVAQIPVGRGGHVNDLADLITFLCREVELHHRRHLGRQRRLEHPPTIEDSVRR